LHAAEQHGAKDHVAAAAGPRQQQSISQVEQAGWAHAQQPGLRAQALGQNALQRQPRLFDARTVAPHIQQAKRRRGFVDIAQQLAEERLVLGPAHTQPGLGHEVAERQRGGQPIGLTGKMRLHLPDAQLQRGVVGRQVVVEQQQQPALSRRVLGDMGAQQRGLAHIHAAVPRVEAGLQLLGNILALERDLLDWQQGFAPNHLHRLG